jgi:hypothetical protein
VASGKALVSALADSGLPVIASDGAKAERWLSVVENHNRKVIPVTKMARWLGWQPDDTFLPAWPSQIAPLNAYHRRGTLAAWQAAVQPLARFPVATMVLAGSFAAPLLIVLCYVVCCF